MQNLKVKSNFTYECPYCFASNKEYKHLKFYRVRVGMKTEVMCSYCMQDTKGEDDADESKVE